VYLDCFIADY